MAMLVREASSQQSLSLCVALTYYQRIGVLL